MSPMDLQSKVCKHFAGKKGPLEAPVNITTLPQYASAGTMSVRGGLLIIIKMFWIFKIYDCSPPGLSFKDNRLS